MASIFGLSPQAVDFDELGFNCADTKVRANLENILAVFVAGYNAALSEGDQAAVAAQLTREFDAHHVGFAFEGAGMGYALFDLLAPWSAGRLRAFTDGAGCKHDYIATVGAGFAVARVPWGRWQLNAYLRSLEPAIAWCVIDGYGFHQGIFHPEHPVDAPARAQLPAYARQLYDSGVGRSFWWTQGAQPARIKQAIDRFPQAWRAEMWCGIGVAASYAGGVEARVLDELLLQSGEWSVDYLTGFPFAARMRQRGGNASAWTDRACEDFLNIAADEAADLIATQAGEISDQLAGRDAELRERGYAQLREHLRHMLAQRQAHANPFPAPVMKSGVRYATQ